MTGQGHIHVDTYVLDDKILQDIASDDSVGIRRAFHRSILDTREAQVRAALISLGWTPPPDKEIDHGGNKS